MADKIIKVSVGLSIGYVGCKKSDIIEVPVNDEMTQDEINKEVEDSATMWLWDNVDFWFEAIP